MVTQAPALQGTPLVSLMNHIDYILHLFDRC